jgi:HemY protein
MIRLLVLIGLVALTAAAVGWFATDPGRVVLDFRGWQIETSVGVLVLAAALAMLAVIMVWSLLGWLIAAPGRIGAWRRARRRARGLKALAAGMVAVAAGDAKGARRFARRAGAAEGETPLTLLLSAQAAQLEGDDRAAEKYFTAMLARKETEFLGLRGLVAQATRAGDAPRALVHAERAAKLRPEAGWAHAAVFDLAVKARAWKQAEDALGQAIRRGGIGREDGNRHRAALLLMQSAEAEQQGFAVEALRLAVRARRADAGFAPAAFHRARLEAEQGNRRRARRILERAFADHPHTDLAVALLALAEGEGEALVLDRLRLAARLLDRAPEAAEAHLVAAEAALDARIWGKAGRHLDDAEARFAAAGDGPFPARLYRLRARLAEDEGGDTRQAAHWLSQAAAAAPDPRWVCAACGHGAPTWAGLCPDCGGFDTMDWRTPAPLAALAAPRGPAAAALPGIAGALTKD